MNTFGERLRALAADRGFNQSDLAEAAGVTQPGISQLMRNDRVPRAPTLKRLAQVLGCSPAWLLDGTGHVDLAMPESARPTWHIKETYGDGTRSFGNSVTEIFEGDLATAAREIGQNAQDAALQGGVRLEFSFIELTGEYLQKFLRAVRWDQLEPHYRAVAEDQRHRAAQRIKAALDDIDRNQRLFLMRVEDYNATGLLGPELDDGCFSALVRRTEDSRKSDEGSGGRYGLGKNVYSRLSQLDLVLFASDLSQPASGKSSSRFIGRAFFPYHVLGEGPDAPEFEGYSFLGASDPNNKRLRLSLWDAGPLLNELSFARRMPSDFPGKESGASILVVGYRDPLEDVGTNLSESVEKVKRAMADSFWPALASGNLSVAVSHYDNSKLVSRQMVEAADYVPELVGLIDDYRLGTLGSEDPGGADRPVVVRRVLLEVPKRTDGSQPAADHEATLIVRRLLENELSTTSPEFQHINEIAMWRKPQMVVKYLPFPNPGLGAAPFQAMLLCGQAAGASESDEAGELFLALSEPPSHNDWSPDSPDLIRSYAKGAKTHLRSFIARVKDAIREVVMSRPDRQPAGPQDLADLLSVPSEGDPERGGVRVASLSRIVSPNGARAVQVTVRCPRTQRGRWTFVPTLMSKSETGGPVKLVATSVAVKNCRLINGRIRVTDSNRDAVFQLLPEWGQTNVNSSFAALFVDITEAVKDRPEIGAV